MTDEETTKAVTAALTGTLHFGARVVHVQIPGHVGTVIAHRPAEHAERSLWTVRWDGSGTETAHFAVNLRLA